VIQKRIINSATSEMTPPRDHVSTILPAMMMAAGLLKLKHQCKWRERIPQPGISGNDVVRNSLHLNFMFTL